MPSSADNAATVLTKSVAVAAASCLLAIAPATVGVAATAPSPSPSSSARPVSSAGAVPSVEVGGSSSGDALMPYAKFVDGATAQHGLFTVWRKQSKVYLEIAPDQLDHAYLLVPILANGLGRGLFAGLHFQTLLWSFQRVGNQIVTAEQNPYGKARPDTPAALAVANSYPQSVISSDPVVAIDPATGRIVFGADALLSDVVDLTTVLNGPPGENRSPVRYGLNPRLSFFGPTKAFPQNVDVEADLTMSSTLPGPIDTVPDSRSLFIKLHYSIVEMPSDGYRPRLADDRLGYFITARRQYDDEQTPTSFVRYIHRWHLEKSDPSARLSKARNSIIYYLSNDIPRQYRTPITRALLTWNAAFERIGIQDAIEVRQQPADPDWDPDDARYSVVRWVVSPDAAFAYGPSYVNPLTGEIFRGDIVIDGNLVRFGRGELERLVEPTRGMTPQQSLQCSLDDCDYGFEAREQAAWAALALRSEGAFKRGAPPPEWYVDSFLESIVLHESGHTLGLRHNFESSTIFTPAELRDRRFTQAHGLVGSVMEYTPVNLSPHGEPQGSYFQTMLGPWDYFSIRYGYESISARSPEGELPELHRLAAQATQPQLRYATDEDNSWGDGFATDPRVNTFDLSSDPLAYTGDVLKIDRRLFDTLLARWPRPGASYMEARQAFAAALQSWWAASRYATHYIGGEYFTRNHRGDPGAKPPFTPVARADERRAFELLDRYAFADEAFIFSPALLNSLGDDRFSHWQSYANDLGRLDFPLDEFVQAYQLQLLGQMWQPTVLARLAEMESRVTRASDTMSLADLYDWSDESIWGDLGSTRGSIPRNHRALQHRYAELLVHIMLTPDPGTPSDARPLARHHLAWLDDRLAAALHRGGWDEATTANLEDVKTMVERALGASAILPLP